MRARNLFLKLAHINSLRRGIKDMKRDLTGKIFGRLTVVEKAGKNKYNEFLWKCECECGNIIIKPTSYLKNSVHPSCGCWGKEIRSELMKDRNSIHNNSKTRLYKEWKSMKDRCYRKNHIYYNYYGEKGIQVCQEWRDNFEQFKDWALNNGYQDDLTIDRIDNDKDYCPENCRWVTQKEQANNRTNNIYAYYQGKLLPLIKIIEITNKPYSTVYSYYKRRNELYGKKHRPLPKYEMEK